MLQDQAIDWIRKRKVWSYWELKGLISAALTAGAGSEAFAEGGIIQSPTDSGVVLGEISTLGIVAAKFSAAGDIMLGEVDLPYDVDPNYPVGFRINWSGPGTAGAGVGVTWILLHKVIKKGAVFSAGDVALDTVFGESLITIANGNEWTSRGIKKRLGLTRKDVEDGAALSLSIEADIIDAGTFAHLLNLEMDYVPITTVGSGCHTDRPLFTNGKG